MSERIVVFRALYLGDLLVAVPALRALRRAHQQAEITLIGLPWAVEFASRFDSYIDRFLLFPGYPGLAEAPVDPDRTETFLVEQRAYGYDLAIQLHGSGETSNPFVLALGARRTAGYYHGAAPVGLDLALPYPTEEPEVWRNLRLAELCGATHLDPTLEFPLLAADRAEADGLIRDLVLRGAPLIGLHPGAKMPSRRWPAERFAAVADELYSRFGARIVLTGGPGEEDLAQAVASRMMFCSPALAAGRTSLGGLAGLIERLDLFISNDTGPAHIAQAVGTNSVNLFGPSELTRWAPLDQACHRVLQRPVACHPCMHWHCPIDHRCLRGISVDEVVRAACDLLPVGVAA